jgi:hypothetical protein
MLTNPRELWNFALGADIRGIDLRRRKVPQGSPSSNNESTRRRIINKLMTMVTPLSWGDNAWYYYPMYKNGVLNYVDIKT